MHISIEVVSLGFQRWAIDYITNKRKFGLLLGFFFFYESTKTLHTFSVPSIQPFLSPGPKKKKKPEQNREKEGKRCLESLDNFNPSRFLYKLKSPLQCPEPLEDQRGRGTGAKPVIFLNAWGRRRAGESWPRAFGVETLDLGLLGWQFLPLRRPRPFARGVAHWLSGVRGLCPPCPRLCPAARSFHLTAGITPSHQNKAAFVLQTKQTASKKPNQNNTTKKIPKTKPPPKSPEPLGCG